LAHCLPKFLGRIGYHAQGFHARVGGHGAVGHDVAPRKKRIEQFELDARGLKRGQRMHVRLLHERHHFLLGRVVAQRNMRVGIDRRNQLWARIGAGNDERQVFHVRKNLPNEPQRRFMVLGHCQVAVVQGVAAASGTRIYKGVRVKRRQRKYMGEFCAQIAPIARGNGQGVTGVLQHGFVLA